MSLIKKIYSFHNKRQIWRIIPTDSDKLIIEEREPDSKEVFFNCIEAQTGKNIFKDFQLDEKFWIGIETVYKDIIYFHKFHKPDMPGHIGIIAFDINQKRTIWASDDYTFHFAYDDNLYCYRQNFEGRNFFRLHYKTGELIDELADDPGKINFYRKQSNILSAYENYNFPKQYSSEAELSDGVKRIINEIKDSFLISGKIEYLTFGNRLLFNFHHVIHSGNELKNIFRIVEIDSGKVIFEEELNSGLKAYVPGSFFMKDNSLFLLKDKRKLLVYSVKR
jgi:hypothetical protein